MRYDLALSTGSTATRDLTLAWVTGRDEVKQRLITRLARVRAEWFLNNRVGLPYYDFEGEFSLLDKGKQGELILRIMEEALRTDGVKSILDVELSGSRYTNQTLARLSVRIYDNTELEIAMNSLGEWS